MTSLHATVTERVSKVVRDVQVLSARTPVRAPLHLPVPLLPLTPVNATSVSPFTSSTTRNRSITTADVSAEVVEPKKQRVLVIGVDGTNLERILADPVNNEFRRADG